MKRGKRLLAFLLTLVLCVGMLPTSAIAADFSSGTSGSSSAFSDGAGSWSEPVQPTEPAEEVQPPAETEGETSDVEEIIIEGEDPSEEEEAPVVEEEPSAEETPAVEEPAGEEIPEEEFTSEEETSVVVEEPTVDQEPVMVSRNSVVLLDATDNDQVVVSVEGISNTTEHTIILGELNDTNDSLKIEGYDFVRAQIGSADDYTIITGLYKIADSDDYYATIEGNTTTGMRISNTKDVTLVYETHRETYTVTYQVQVGGNTYTENFDSMVAVTGASSVKSGSTLEFAAVVQDGYSLGDISVEPDASVIPGDNSTYSVEGIKANTVITLELNEVNEYTMSFAGSNTTLTYNGTTYNSRHDSSGQHTFSWSYDAGDEIIFTLNGQNEWSSETKIMNQLSITVDDTATAAEIPDSVDQSVVTTIAKGYEVNVTKISAGRYPVYSVVITNPVEGGKVRGNIHIQTNFKDYNTSEVWAKQLDGVEPLAYSHGRTVIYEDGKGDQNSRLQPEVYTYYSRDRDSASTYYIKLTGQYNAEDLYLTVVSYGAPEEGGDAELQYTLFDGVRVSDLAEATIDSRYGDYQYQFVIPANEGGTENYYLSTSRNGERYNGTVYQKNWYGWYTEVSNPRYDNTYYYKSGNGYRQLYWVQDTSASGGNYQDIRIYIQYRPQADAEYTITYDTDGGSSVAPDSKVYKAGDSAVLSEVIPTREGFVFDGWYLERASETLYDSGKLFTITEDNTSYADYVDEGKYKFVFKAKWTESSQATSAPFTVQIFFQDENLTYPDEAEIITSERGRVGSTAYIIPSALESVLNQNNPDWSKYYEYDKQETDTPILADGTTVLNIYYKLKVFQVYHTGVKGGNVETIPMNSLKDGTYDLTQNLTANTLYGGYYLSYTNAETGEAYNGSNATWSDPQTENGKNMHPKAGKTYYVKEVPAAYLQATQVTIYHRYTLQLRTMVLTTVVDDANYKNVGFRFNDTDYDKSVNVDNLYESLTFKMPERDGTETIETVDVGDLSKGQLSSGKIAAYDYFNYINSEGVVDYSSVIGTNRIKAYWITPDGITVTGGYQRTLIVRDTDKDSIIEVDGTVDGEMISNKEILYLDSKSAIQILNR